MGWHSLATSRKFFWLQWSKFFEFYQGFAKRWDEPNIITDNPECQGLVERAVTGQDTALGFTRGVPFLQVQRPPILAG
jgi:hypothetical protein